MIRRSLLALAVLVLATGPALAINPAIETNAIGVFFEPTADTNCANPIGEQIVTAYLCSVNVPRDAGITGWEGTLLINPTNLTGLTLDIPPDAVNSLVPPVFNCTFPAYHAENPCVLVTISFLYTTGEGGTGPVAFGVAPAMPSTWGAGGNPLEGLCAGYVSGDILGGYYPVSTETYWNLPIWKGENTDPNLPETGPGNGYMVAGVNLPGPCPISTEQTSWGGVKTLYR